eukprot:scaffold110144_cov60-Phaeocystis_antarctica.AAC.3
MSVPLGQVYGDALRHYRLPCPDDGAMKSAFKRAYGGVGAELPNFGAGESPPMPERVWWNKMIRATLNEMPPPRALSGGLRGGAAGRGLPAGVPADLLSLWQRRRVVALPRGRGSDAPCEGVGPRRRRGVQRLPPLRGQQPAAARPAPGPRLRRHIARAQQRQARRRHLRGGGAARECGGTAAARRSAAGDRTSPGAVLIGGVFKDGASWTAHSFRTVSPQLRG